MREIKFRAWAIKDDRHVIYDWTPYRSLISEWIGNEENGVTFMQYTGLKDKNGVEIYEGDILKSQPKNMQVVYQGATFSLGDGEFVWEFGSGIDEYTPNEVEVIGNIYENPELLGNKDARS